MSQPPPPAGRYPTFVQMQQTAEAQMRGALSNTTSTGVSREQTAQTLGQFWRSDARVLPGRRKVVWPGTVALWAAILFAVGFVAAVGIGLLALAVVALAVGVAAGFFTIVAVVAGLGRGRALLAAVGLVVLAVVLREPIALLVALL
jgi:hypothetical protein